MYIPNDGIGKQQAIVEPLTLVSKITAAMISCNLLADLNMTFWYLGIPFITTAKQ
jgi:ABC-type Na+ efflux pump permease subunit